MCRVTDEETGEGMACRVYLQNVDSGAWHHVTSTAIDGSAINYQKEIARTGSVERHTTVSADPFQADLPPGRYRVRVERGKEFLPAETTVVVEDSSGPQDISVSMKRIADMAARGWYSGDTHVHRWILTRYTVFSISFLLQNVSSLHLQLH